MSLSVGIIGLPNVGKSTLFNALLKKQQAYVANYPFATIEPNVGIVPVPDERLAKLAETVASSRIYTEGGKGKETLTYLKLPPLVPATVKFVDIAGIVKGASQGEGLGNKFLSHIRETNLLCLVVRAFNDSEVVQSGSGNMKGDLETIMVELILADMETVNKQAEPKGKVTPEQKKRFQAIQAIKVALDLGNRADTADLDDKAKALVSDLGLLTMKPVLYVVNTDEYQLEAKFADLPADQLVICAKTEAELASLTEPEQNEYLKSLGLQQSGLERLIQASYTKLGLISFLTAGEIECRAWTITKGTTAVEASGVIHTDFMKKFIKADVVAWEDFVSLGGWKKARDRGVVRSEGRDFVMVDGLVVEFKIGA